jgi:hypothetical protein
MGGIIAAVAAEDDSHGQCQSFMDTLPAPVFTTFYAVTQGLAALVYLFIGVGASLRAPRDVRTRVFLALSIANVLALLVPTLMWMRGITDPTKLPKVATVLVLSGLGIGALLLFHFTQVFPRRRPWIRTAGIQIPVAYVLVPAAIGGLVWFVPKTVAELSPGYVIAFFIFGFPLIVLLAIVLPIAAILSLVKSHRDVQQDGLDRFRRPLEWILIGQVAGGTLAVLFAPVLTALAPNTLALTVVTVAIWALGLLTPLAFAAAVWKFDLLSLDAG